MKPIELYNIKPMSVTTDLNILHGCTYNHIPEIIINNVLDEEIIKKNDKISIKIYKNLSIDERRFWLLASVWFEDKPVMIIQNAGREGDDHKERFITDEKLYIKMINYIKIIIPLNINDIKDIVNDNDEIEDLISFYGECL
jgi:hypothetical protein